MKNENVMYSFFVSSSIFELLPSSRHDGSAVRVFQGAIGDGFGGPVVGESRHRGLLDDVVVIG